MDSPHELVTFVTRAESRIVTARTLADGPLTRHELQETTGIPRATLSRILADFRDRELVVRSGHEYGLTSLGEVLVDELESTFEAVAAMETLQTVRQWLAVDEYDIPVERLADADVVVPEPSDPMAPVRRAEDLLAAASSARVLAYSMVPGCLDAVWRAVMTGRQTFEGVLTRAAVKTMLDDPPWPHRHVTSSGATAPTATSTPTRRSHWCSSSTTPCSSPWSATRGPSRATSRRPTSRYWRGRPRR